MTATKHTAEVNHTRIHGFCINQIFCAKHILAPGQEAVNNTEQLQNNMTFSKGTV